MGADDAALLYDGRISINGAKVDAIIIEVGNHFSPESKAIVAVPYHPVATGRFRVHEPRVVKWENCDDFDVNIALERFFEGVRSYPDTAKYWDAYFEKLESQL